MLHALHANAVPEEVWEDNPFRTLLPPDVGRGLDIYELTITHAHPHQHDTYDQVYIVKAGRGVMQIGAEQQTVEPGWLVHIPRGQQHSLAPLDGAPVVLYSLVHHLP